MTDKCILLVEDSPNDATLTLKALKKHHVANEIVWVRDGAEALDYLFARGTYAPPRVTHRPSLVLLDIKLPKKDGLEVLQEIRANESTALLPVVMLTSSVEEIDLVRCYTNGANSYVRKPVDFDQFMGAVQQLGLYWLVLNNPPPETRSYT